jgi:hypothetical protein
MENERMRALLCHCRHPLEAEDDQMLSALVREHLIREHPALEPTDEQVQEILTTRAYDLEDAEAYADEELIFEPYQ